MPGPLSVTVITASPGPTAIPVSTGCPAGCGSGRWPAGWPPPGAAGAGRPAPMTGLVGHRQPPDVVGSGGPGVADRVDHHLGQVGRLHVRDPDRSPAGPAAAGPPPGATSGRPRTPPATSRTRRRLGSSSRLAPGQLGVAADRGQRVAQLVGRVGHELPHLGLARLPGGQRLLDVVQHVVERLPDPADLGGRGRRRPGGTRTARATSPRSSCSWETCWAVAATRFSGRRLRSTTRPRGDHGPRRRRAGRGSPPARSARSGRLSTSAQRQPDHDRARCRCRSTSSDQPVAAEPAGQRERDRRPIDRQDWSWATQLARTRRARDDGDVAPVWPAVTADLAAAPVGETRQRGCRSAGRDTETPAGRRVPAPGRAVAAAVVAAAGPWPRSSCRSSCRPRAAGWPARCSRPSSSATSRHQGDDPDHQLAGQRAPAERAARRRCRPDRLRRVGSADTSAPVAARSPAPRMVWIIGGRLASIFLRR